MIEHRAAAGLRGVGGQHRLDQRAREQRAHVVGGQAGGRHRGDRGDQAVGAVGALPQHADALLLLGDVHQVAPLGVRPRRLLELAQLEPGDLLRERAAAAGQGAVPQPGRVLAEAADQGQGFLTGDAPDRGVQRGFETLEIVV